MSTCDALCSVCDRLHAQTLRLVARSCRQLFPPPSTLALCTFACVCSRLVLCRYAAPGGVQGLFAFPTPHGLWLWGHCSRALRPLVRLLRRAALLCENWVAVSAHTTRCSVSHWGCVCRCCQPAHVACWLVRLASCDACRHWPGTADWSVFARLPRLRDPTSSTKLSSTQLYDWLGPARAPGNKRQLLLLHWLMRDGAAVRARQRVAAQCLSRVDMFLPLV